MSLPNDQPIFSKKNYKPIKSSEPKDTNPRLRESLDVSRKIAEQAAQQIWNILVNEIHKRLPEIPTTDALSIMTTSVSYYIAWWALMMKKLIADKDGNIHAGMDEIFNTIMQGAEKVASTAIWKDHD